MQLPVQCLQTWKLDWARQMMIALYYTVLIKLTSLEWMWIQLRYMYYIMISYYIILLVSASVYMNLIIYRIADKLLGKPLAQVFRTSWCHAILIFLLFAMLEMCGMLVSGVLCIVHTSFCFLIKFITWSMNSSSFACVWPSHCVGGMH